MVLTTNFLGSKGLFIGSKGR